MAVQGAPHKVFLLCCSCVNHQCHSCNSVNVLTYAVMLLHLLGMDSESAVIMLKWLGIAPFILLYLMNVLSPMPVTTERMITIAFP